MSFKNLSIFTHLLSLLAVILNFCLLTLVVVNHRLFRIEGELNMWGPRLSTLVNISALLGLSSAFFAGCVISSRIKFYMRVYLLYIFFNILILVTVVFYIGVFSITQFNSSVGFELQSVTQTGTAIETFSQEINPSTETIKVITKVYTSISNRVLILCTIVLLLDIFSYITIKIAKNVREPIPIRPLLRRVGNIGMSTGTLRKKYEPEIESIDNINMSTAYSMV